MAQHTGHRKKRRFLEDFLRAEHWEFLEREWDQLGEAIVALWYLSRVPYPLDADTAAAIQGSRDYFVLPYPLLDYYIEEWTYPQFRDKAVRFSESLRTSGITTPEVPELETLRAFLGDEDGRRILGLEAWPEEFAEDCQATCSLIQGLLQDYPVLEGRYLLLPYLPLSDNALSYVPLVDCCWLDRRLVELAETTALLLQRGYTRVHPLDRHPLSWHRFFKPCSRWREPSEAPRERFLDTLEAVTRETRGLPWRIREVARPRRGARLPTPPAATAAPCPG
jgi:hypothetical protein